MVSEAKTFIGEIAFLLSRPATATVTLETGCHYCVWDSKTLHAVLEGNAALKTALSAAMNRKLAEKVAQAGVLTDVIGDTLKASGTAAPKAKVKGTVAPRKIARVKKGRRSLQKA
jgi:CRP-like cAMP-binding protein